MRGAHDVVLVALAFVALACLSACDDGKPIGPYDSGIAPDLGRACAYHDGGGVDFGGIPDFGTITGPNLDAAPPDYGPSTPELINGCLPLDACLASEGAGSVVTYDGFATHVFTSYCVRCHSTTLVGSTARHGAPGEYNWDDRASVYAHLQEIRSVIGVSNFMPFDRPSDLSCDLRRGMVTWIDTGAP